MDGPRRPLASAARRTRNVYRRPLLFIVVATSVFVTSLIVLALVPREAQRAARAAMPLPSEFRDTVEAERRLAEAMAGASAADSALRQARAFALAARNAALADTLPTALRPRRDSLAAALAALAELEQRAEDAPLVASYRALGSLPQLQSERLVRSLLDSLAQIEKARQDLGAATGADPIFVALTSRATEIGKEIQGIAAERHGALARELDAMTPRRSAVIVPDTAALVRAQDSTVAAAARARAELDAARRANASAEARAERARETAAIGAAPLAMLGAALVLGVAVGFGVSFTLEVRRPHVADAAEAASLAGAPVLATVAGRAGEQQRRRAADREVPPLIDLASEVYPALFAQLADRQFRLPLVVITGDDPMVAATIAANLAAAIARQARGVLLVDTDAGAQAVAAAVRVPAAPGLSDVLAGLVEWPQAVCAVVVGRERTMDVLASGTRDASVGAGGTDERLTGLMEHLGRRYETIVATASARRGGSVHGVVASGVPVVLSLRAASTPAAVVRDLVSLVAARGATLRGVVLWARGDPLPGVDE